MKTEQYRITRIKYYIQLCEYVCVEVFFVLRFHICFIILLLCLNAFKYVLDLLVPYDLFRPMLFICIACLMICFFVAVNVLLLFLSICCAFRSTCLINTPRIYEASEKS